MEELKYKLDNLNIKTYSPSAEFQIGNEYVYLMIKGNTIVSVAYMEFGFSFSNYTVTIEDKENYTKVGSNYYLCLTSDCKYICEEYEYDSYWELYSNKCYKKASDFDGFFNKAFNQVYTAAKNYDPTQNNLRRSLLEEKEEEEEKNNKKVKVTTAGYYKEDVKEGENGHYKGYFLIGNELTIVEQTSAYGQNEVIQKKLVLNLDETTSIYI